MKNTREFMKTGKGRYVLAATDGIHTYHPECVPADVVTLTTFVSTRQSCCATCHGLLRQDPLEVQP